MLSGGEALMQAPGALIAAFQELKSRGFATGLHASGAYPRRLAELVQADAPAAVASTGPVAGLNAYGPAEEASVSEDPAPLLDWVGLDVKALPDQYAMVTGTPAAVNKVEQSLEVLASQSRVDWEARLTLWPGLLGEGRSKALGYAEAAAGREELLDYGRQVAKWAYDRGARKFALQRYRVPAHVAADASGAGADGVPSETTLADAGIGSDLGWTDDQARALLSPIGFDVLEIR